MKTHCENDIKATKSCTHRCGIAMDAWMFPLGDELYHHTVNQPVMFINSETFHWKKNIQQIKQLLNNDIGKLILK